jgi:hypothetical protein
MSSEMPLLFSIGIEGVMPMEKTTQHQAIQKGVSNTTYIVRNQSQKHYNKKKGVG